MRSSVDRNVKLTLDFKLFTADNGELSDKMNFSEAKSEMKQLLGRVDPSELPRLISWIQGSGGRERTPSYPAVMHEHPSAAMNWSHWSHVRTNARFC